VEKKRKENKKKIGKLSLSFIFYIFFFLLLLLLPSFSLARYSSSVRNGSSKIYWTGVIAGQGCRAFPGYMFL